MRRSTLALTAVAAAAAVGLGGWQGARLLRDVGCRLVQGYLLGRPAVGFPAPCGLAGAPA